VAVNQAGSQSSWQSIKLAVNQAGSQKQSKRNQTNLINQCSWQPEAIEKESNQPDQSMFRALRNQRPCSAVILAAPAERTEAKMAKELICLLLKACQHSSADAVAASPVAKQTSTKTIKSRH